MIAFNPRGETRESSKEFKRVQESSGEFKRLQETSGEFRRLQESPGELTESTESSEVNRDASRRETERYPRKIVDRSHNGEKKKIYV